MNKNELEWRKKVVASQNLKNTFDLLKHVVTVSAAVLCIYLIFSCLTDLVKAEPASLKALSDFAEKLNLGTTIAYVISLICGAGWYHERKGKKRAIQKSGKFRDMVEETDAHNEGSGLDLNGHTPQLTEK